MAQQGGALMQFVHRRRRGAELFLLVLALLVGIGAYAAVGLGVEEKVPADIVSYGGWLAALIIAAHITVRLVAPYADPVLLPIVAALNGLGLAEIHRLDLALNTHFARQQLTWMTLGVALFIATLVFLRDHRVLQRFTYTCGLLAIVLLLLPMAPGVGRNINGARIWIRIGPASFQPGELAKLLLAIFFAGYLVEKRELLQTFTRRIGPVSLPDPKFLGPVLGAWGFSLVVMIFEKDLGSSLLFFALFVAMLWVATARGFYLALGGLLFSSGAFIAYRSFAHVENRVAIWLDPFEDAGGRGFQLVQSLFAFGSGGVFGTGLSLGSPTKIPAVETDFIFAAIGEEMGLLGPAAIVTAFLLLVGCGLRIAIQARSDFEKLLATGLTVCLGVQTFIILGGVTRLVPLTGITLPFVSYGGSSLLANYILLALLLRISSDSVERGGSRG